MSNFEDPNFGMVGGDKDSFEVRSYFLSYFNEILVLTCVGSKILSELKNVLV